MKKILSAVLLFSIAGCGSMMKRNEIIVFTENETTMGLKSAEEVGLDFSYDYDSEIYGFYGTGAVLALTDAKKNEDEKKLSAFIEKQDQQLLVSYYSKVYENYYSALFRKRFYEKKKDWSGYNYIVKTILPGTEYYLYLSEQSLSRKMPDVKKRLDDQKMMLKKKAVVAQMDKLSVTDEF